MIKKTEIKFVGDSYKMPAVQLNAQTCINWYEVYDPTGKFAVALFPDPGLQEWSNFSHEKCRGLFQINDVLYAVFDNSFYSIDGNGWGHQKGYLRTSAGNVRMMANDNQIFVTDGKYGYVYQIVATEAYPADIFFEITSTSSEIGDPTFDGAGLDDMFNGGAYEGSTAKTYIIQIDNTDASIDTFKWSDTGGVSFNAENVSITGSDQELSQGVTIIFGNTTGHTLGDKWTFSVTTDDSFYVPLVPGYQDTYGIYVRKNSQRWYISDINDFSKVNALDFAQADAWPDQLTAAISLREELWLIGRTTTEVWYNVGAAAFPFERRSNLLIKYGCIAPYSIAVAHNNILFWLANNEEGGKVIVMAPSYNPEIISTEPINAELETYDKVDDAIAGVYQWDGHIFYWITFPTADRTWVYDMTTKSWHEKRSTLDNVQPNTFETRQGRWRANNYAYFKGNHIFGDFQSGKLYKLSRDDYTEDGTYVLRERTTRTLMNQLHRLSIYSIELDMQKAVGKTTVSSQGHDPQVMLQVSTDGGIKWGNEMWRSIGKTGEYSKRIKWNRLGLSDSFVFRVRVTDPVYTVLLGAIVEAEDTQT